MYNFSISLSEVGEGGKERGREVCVCLCASTSGWMMSVLDTDVHMVMAMSYSGEGR